MTQKDELVEKLEEMTVMMELADENIFKIRALQNGSRVLDKMQIDLPAAVADGSLKGVKGIGKGLLELIQEFVATGDIAEYHELKATVPAGVLSLTKLRGVGAKKARQLHEELDINSIGELEYACKENRLVELKGFGEKTQASILNSIAIWQAAQGKCLQSGGNRIAQSIIAECQELGSTRVEISGALRRRAEVIEDIVLVQLGASLDALVAHFEAVELADELRFIRDGMQVRLLSPDAKHFESTLFRSSAHSDFLKAFGGLSAADAAASEEKIFENHGFAFVPVELREDADVLRMKKLPRLLESSDMRGMLHIHTTWSDGANSVEEMALETKRLGFEYVAICDHSKTAVYANGLSVERVKAQHAEIAKVNAAKPGISVLRGIESDILSDGSLDYDDEILEQFDVVVASVHSAFQLPKEQQTARIIAALRNPYTTILGHPTGRLLLARPGYELDMEAILQVAAETGTVIELNANPHRFDLDWRWHRRAVELGVKIAINPDSHQCATLSEVFLGVGIGRKGMLRAEDVINTMSEVEFRRFCAELRQSKMKR